MVWFHPFVLFAILSIYEVLLLLLLAVVASEDGSFL